MAIVFCNGLRTVDGNRLYNGQLTTDHGLVFHVLPGSVRIISDASAAAYAVGKSCGHGATGQRPARNGARTRRSPDYVGDLETRAGGVKSIRVDRELSIYSSGESAAQACDKPNPARDLRTATRARAGADSARRILLQRSPRKTAVNIRRAESGAWAFEGRPAQRISVRLDGSDRLQRSGSSGWWATDDAGRSTLLCGASPWSCGRAQAGIVDDRWRANRFDSSRGNHANEPNRRQVARFA